LFVIVFEAIRFNHMKLLVEQAFFCKITFDQKAFETFEELGIC